MNAIIVNITILSTGFVLSAFGAIQPGLVNLMVAKTAHLGKNSDARLISLGAASIEVLYGLIAVVAGRYLQISISKTPLFTIVILLTLSSIGIYFMLKKETIVKPSKNAYNAFLTGMKLNVISFQMLLFWILAITLSSTIITISLQFQSLITLSVGIFIGKLLVLYIYQSTGKNAFSKLKYLNRNTNKIIGLLFILAAIVQAITLK